MRSLTLFTILGAAGALAACSGGGPGGLDITPLDLGHEPGGNTYEAPPNKGASLAGQAGTDDKNPTGPTNGKPSTDPPTGDAGPITADDGGTTKKDSGTVTEGDASVVSGTCADLEGCCAGVPTAQKTSCDSALEAAGGKDTTCASYYTAFKNAGYCE